MKILAAIAILLILGLLCFSIQDDLNARAQIKACRAAWGTPFYDLNKKVVCMSYFTFKETGWQSTN